MNYLKKDILKIIVGLMISVLISACDRSGPLCYYADDFGDQISERKEIEPIKGSKGHDASGWKFSGIEVKSGAPLQIRANGFVDLCEGSSNTNEKVTVIQNSPGASSPTNKNSRNHYIASPCTGPNDTCTAAETAAGKAFYKNKISSRDHKWKNLSVDIVKGKYYEIFASGRISHWDSQKWQEFEFLNGDHLYFHVGDPPGHPSLIQNTTKDPSVTVDPEFMYLGKNNMLRFRAQSSGKLWARYRDLCRPPWTKTFDTEDCTSDNHGEYDIKIIETTPAATYKFSPSSTISGWQDSGVTLDPAKHKKFSIEILGQYSVWATNDWPGETTSRGCPDMERLNPAYVDDDCFSRQGKGLFANIGIPQGGLNGIWAGSPIGPGPANGSNDPKFFELYGRSGSLNQKGNYPATTPVRTGVGPTEIKDLVTGTNKKLYFRYRDGDNRVINAFRYPQYYANNIEGYTAFIKLYADCTGRNGEFLTYFVGDNPPTSLFDPNQAGVINLSSAKNGTPAGTWNGKATKTGKLWLKIFDNQDKDWDNDGKADGRGDKDFSNNEGKYLVDIKTTAAPTGGISDLIDDIVGPVKKAMYGTKADPTANPPVIAQDGLIQKMFDGITKQGAYINLVRAVIALFIVFYAISYMLGIVSISQKELMILLIKVGIVMTFTDPKAWQIFHTYFFRIFIDGLDDLIRVFTAHFSTVINNVSDPSQTLGEPATITLRDGAASTFEFLNQTLARFFSIPTNQKIRALLTSFPMGPLYALFIYLGMMFFLFVIVKAIIIYLTSVMVIGLLLFLAPLFTLLWFFNRTKGLFDTYINNLFSYTLQPILLFAALSLFNVFIYSSFYYLMSYSVCWACVFEIDLPLSELISKTTTLSVPNFDKVCIITNYAPWGYDSGSHGVDTVVAVSNPINFYALLIFLIFINAAYKFADWALVIANNFTAGLKGNTAQGAVGQALNNAAQIPVIAAKGVAKTMTDAAKILEYVGSTGYAIGTKMRDGSFNTLKRNQARRSLHEMLDKFENTVDRYSNQLSGGLADLIADADNRELLHKQLKAMQAADEKEKEIEKNRKKQDELDLIRDKTKDSLIQDNLNEYADKQQKAKEKEEQAKGKAENQSDKPEKGSDNKKVGSGVNLRNAAENKSENEPSPAAGDKKDEPKGGGDQVNKKEEDEPVDEEARRRVDKADEESVSDEEPESEKEESEENRDGGDYIDGGDHDEDEDWDEDEDEDWDEDEDEEEDAEPEDEEDNNDK